MGQAYSSYKSKRREKADRKRRQGEQLEEAMEYIFYLQKEQERLNEILKEHYMYYPDFRSELRDGIEYRTAVMKEEAEALERKLYLEEIALDVTDKRCDFLDRNLSLLQQNEVDLEYQNSIGQRNLSAFKLKHEACQFGGYQRANPIEKWTVTSLPNLYFASF